MDYNITYREKDKGWQYIISYKDQNGKWRQKSKQGFKTKGAAKKAADKMLEEMKKDFKLQESLNSEFKGITFKEFKKIFIKDLSIHSEQNTLLSYEATFKNFSKCDDLPMKNIQFLNIQECVNDMIERGFCSKTIKGYITRIRTIFDSAIKPYKIILENPVDDDIKVPESKESEKIKALNKLELDELLRKVRPVNYRIISLIAATSGLRIGEIIGLTWTDISFKEKTIDVNKQWKRLKDGHYGFGKVKSKKSVRTVPIPPKTVNALKKYRKDNPTDIYNRVFLYKNTSSVGTRLAREYKKCGFDISVHDLRHTYATFLVSSGLDFKTIAKLLGHSVEMTIKIYSHVTDDMMSAATKMINSVF